MAARMNAPDQLKGILLALVVYGHTYLAVNSQDPVKWMIYGFHMPVFFVLSGWLWREASLRDRSLPELVGQLWRRMLRQWLLVSVAFNLWLGRTPDDVRGVWHDYVLFPYFHLWFVPALAFMIVLTQVLLRAGCGWRTLALVAGAGLVFELPARAEVLPVPLTEVDSRYGAFLAWFLLGFAIRNAPWPALRSAGLWVWAPLVVAGLAVYAWSYPVAQWSRDVGFVLLNVGLALALPMILRVLESPLPLVGRALITVGRASLWIYLLHPFVTLRVAEHDPGGGSGRLVGAGVTVAVLGAGVLVDVAVRRLRLRLRSRRAAARARRRPPELDAATLDPAALDPGLGATPGATGEIATEIRTETTTERETVTA